MTATAQQKWNAAHPEVLRDAARRYREKHGDRARAATAAIRLRNHAFVRGVKSHCLCELCGTVENLIFHHRDRNTKGFNLSRPGSHALSAVQAEMEKCGVLCKTCHDGLT